MTVQNAPDPTAIYIEFQHKVESGHEFSAAEGMHDLQRLFHALGATIRENANLRSRIETTEALNDELKIENTLKDLEIFNHETQWDRLAENDG